MSALAALLKRFPRSLNYRRHDVVRFVESTLSQDKMRKCKEKDHKHNDQVSEAKIDHLDTFLNAYRMNISLPLLSLNTAENLVLTLGRPQIMVGNGLKKKSVFL